MASHHLLSGMWEVVEQGQSCEFCQVRPQFAHLGNRNKNNYQAQGHLEDKMRSGISEKHKSKLLLAQAVFSHLDQLKDSEPPKDN